MNEIVITSYMIIVQNRLITKCQCSLQIGLNKHYLTICSVVFNTDVSASNKFNCLAQLDNNHMSWFKFRLESALGRTEIKASMAKLVRHLTSNEEIIGSNPVGSISFLLIFLQHAIYASNYTRFIVVFFFLFKVHTTRKSE
ncbi:hypothetical protein JTP64_001964 [Candida tropicalis]|nr:hypothetical protein JTP64_001964 [Candida tropicalis]